MVCCALGSRSLAQCSVIRNSAADTSTFGHLGFVICSKVIKYLIVVLAFLEKGRTSSLSRCYTSRIFVSVVTLFLYVCFISVSARYDVSLPSFHFHNSRIDRFSRDYNGMTGKSSQFHILKDRPVIPVPHAPVLFIPPEKGHGKLGVCTLGCGYHISQTCRSSLFSRIINILV